MQVIDLAFGAKRQGGFLGTASLCPSHITCCRLYDVLELGVERYQGIKDFTQAAKLVQLGNKVRT